VSALLLQVHVRHLPTVQNTHLGQNWLADLTAAWKEAGLWITRAKVRGWVKNVYTNFFSLVAAQRGLMGVFCFPASSWMQHYCKTPPLVAPCE
jgi:hypothetical protein